MRRKSCAANALRHGAIGTRGRSHRLGAGDPAYLSFDLGPGFDRSDLNLWHYDGAQWAEYDAADLTYNGDYASFTVTDFSGYAVSAVPEPGTLAMLLGGVVALGWWRRKR